MLVLQVRYPRLIRITFYFALPTESDMTSHTDQLNPLAAMLPEIRRNAQNPGWLDAHADDIHDLIRRYSRDHSLDDAVTALKLVAPHYLKRPGYARWARLLTHILPLLMQVGHPDHQQQMWYHLAQYNTLGDHPQSAQTAFTHAADQAREQNREQEWIDACIGLVHSSAFQAAGANGTAAYDELMAYAQQNTNPYTQTLIYRAAAQHHMIYSEATAALSYAQQALAICWQQLERSRYPDSELERTMGQLYTIMASSYRWLGQYEDAEKHILQAQSHLGRLAYEHDLHVSYYEQGALYLETGRYNRVIALLGDVIDHFSEQNYPYYVTAAQHSMGLAYCELAEYTQAQAYLRQAYEGWRKLKNTVQQVNVKHANGYLYLRMGDYERARDVLTDAYQEAALIDNASRRARMQAKIQEDLDTAHQHIQESRQGD